MNTASRIMICIGAGFLAGTAALADTTLANVRLTARDIEGAVRFYQQAFDLKEVNRRHKGKNDELDEVFMAFSDARTMPGGYQSPTLILEETTQRTKHDQTPHLVLRVQDIASTSAAVRAAGGKVAVEPFAVPGGLMIMQIVDPDGNYVQLVQPPRQ